MGVRHSRNGRTMATEADGSNTPSACGARATPPHLTASGGATENTKRQTDKNSGRSQASDVPPTVGAARLPEREHTATSQRAPIPRLPLERPARNATRSARNSANAGPAKARRRWALPPRRPSHVLSPGRDIKRKGASRPLRRDDAVEHKHRQQDSPNKDRGQC